MITNDSIQVNPTNFGRIGETPGAPLGDGPESTPAGGEQSDSFTPSDALQSEGGADDTGDAGNNPPDIFAMMKQLKQYQQQCMAQTQAQPQASGGGSSDGGGFMGFLGKLADVAVKVAPLFV